MSSASLDCFPTRPTLQHYQEPSRLSLPVAVLAVTTIPYSSRSLYFSFQFAVCGLHVKGQGPARVITSLFRSLLNHPKTATGNVLTGQHSSAQLSTAQASSDHNARLERGRRIRQLTTLEALYIEFLAAEI
ncbi:hypothetical protein E4U55_003227 [Claviceps digitariae]|nr:hypothetical protein E4U55_003227 [Claviceps digitariae]